MGGFETWYLALPPLVQQAVWMVAMLLAAAVCGRKARPIYHGGR